MTRRKQRLVLRYLEEMVMRLYQYRTDPECARFMERELVELENLDVAFGVLSQICMSMRDYLSAGHAE